jgi:hypothetical protein
LEWKRSVHSLAILNVLRPFGTFFGPFGNLVAIRYLFPRFGILCQEKSGNPVLEYNVLPNTFLTLCPPSQSVSVKQKFSNNGMLLD